MITVSQTFWCRKWTCIAVRVSVRPRNPLMGQFLGALAAGKAILYFCGYPPGHMVPQYRIPPAALPFCIYCWTASEPNVISSPNSEQCTLTLCFSRYYNHVLVVRCSYTASNLVPAA